jgi:hypothetical protein
LPRHRKLSLEDRQDEYGSAHMKIQIRDIVNWALLGELSLTGKKFTVVGDYFVCDEELNIPIIADGIAMRDAFLVTDQDTFIRVIELTPSSDILKKNGKIQIAAGDLRWGRGR